MRPAWVEIDLKALRNNIRNLKRCIDKNVDFMGVIKADAYGHGAKKVAEVLQEEDINRFAVVLVEEGIELREKGFKEPILILGHTLEEDYKKLIEYRLTPAIFKLSQAKKLNKLAKENNTRIKVHIKVDTGMGRLGFMPNMKSIHEISNISELPNIQVEGIYTHLATADERNNQFAKIQFKRFNYFLSRLKDLGIGVPIRHMANSAATINFRDMHLDMVRPGTSLYGLYPGPEMALNPTIKLYPVMSIKSKLIHIKSVPKDFPISYGGTFVTRRPTLLGIVPMGYVDGVFRQLGNKGEVLIRENRCPIVGNICMDQFIVDITDLEEVNIGDEVVFLGKQGKKEITADEIGKKAGTISIEVVTRISKRMPIIYKD